MKTAKYKVSEYRRQDSKKLNMECPIGAKSQKSRAESGKQLAGSSRPLARHGTCCILFGKG